MFEVFSQRYERDSIQGTTNLPFDEWTEVFHGILEDAGVFDRPGGLWCCR